MRAAANSEACAGRQQEQLKSQMQGIFVYEENNNDENLGGLSTVQAAQPTVSTGG